MRSKPAGFVLSRRERGKALNEKIWTIYYAVMSGVQARRKHSNTDFSHFDLQ